MIDKPLQVVGQYFSGLRIISLFTCTLLVGNEGTWRFIYTSFCATLLRLMLQLVVAFKLRSKKTCILHSSLTRKYIPVSVATMCNRATVVVPLKFCMCLTTSKQNIIIVHKIPFYK